MIIINKAYKYRIYPDMSQQELLAKTFGCCRFVYNKCIDEQKRRHDAGEKHMSYFDMNTYCTQVLKHQYEFLREPDKFALNNAVHALHEGYQRFFNRTGKYPKFKSKHKSKCSYTTNITGRNIVVGNDFIKLPKLGNVKAVIHRHALDDWKLKSVTVSMEADGSYYASVLYEYEANTVVNHNSNAVGLDYKSQGLYADSNGYCAQMPHFYKKSMKRLGRLQRKFSKCTSGSNNREKQRKKVAKLHRHVANQRKDFLHKLSTEIANQYGIVCVESLNMQSMANRGFKNGRSTLDNGYGMFLNMLEYKLKDRGKMLIRVDKWFPSSQICSCCGKQNHELKDLSIRRWICPCCGVEHDRDVNAAVNILNEGIRMLPCA